MIFWWRLGDHYSGVRRSIGRPAVFAVTHWSIAMVKSCTGTIWRVSRACGRSAQTSEGA
jgi:hypothetical protein